MRELVHTRIVHRQIHLAGLHTPRQSGQSRQFRPLRDHPHLLPIPNAQLHGILGHSSEAAGQKPAARESFKSAIAIWEKLAASSANDEVVQTSLTWSKDRLARLK